MPTREYVKQWKAAHADEQRAYYREYRRQHPEHAAAYRRRNPEKVRARSVLNEAIRGGKLDRLPCEICGAPHAEAHHEDYTRPLDVRWLCRDHHHEVHA